MMLFLTPDYARLEIARDREFHEVSQAVVTLFQVCRLNGLRNALIVSRQSGLDWRSCMRLGIRLTESRGILLPKGEGKLALVEHDASDTARKDVGDVADEVGLICRVFKAEDAALRWLAGKAD